MTRVTFSSYEFDITDAIPKDKSKIVTFSNQRRNGRLTKIILQQTTVTLLLDVKMSTHQITIRDKWEKPKTVEEAFAAVKSRRRVGTVVRYSPTFSLLEAIFRCSLTRTVDRSKREKEEETTRTVVVRRRHQSDSDEGGNKIAFWF